MRSDPIDVLLIVAHPDDEVLGAGIWLNRNRGKAVHLVHATDGSPLDMQDAIAAGFTSREAYSAARFAELAAALELAGRHDPETHTRLGIPDKEAYLNLPTLISAVDDLVQRLRPGLVLTPAYEGGHPDHDAVAFAASVVCRRQACEHREFPLYHRGDNGRMVTSVFLRPNGEEDILTLSPEECLQKARMLACFDSQRNVLAQFEIGTERFRRAPEYDFTQPPYSGPLLYETWGWDISGNAWREEAAAVLAAEYEMTGR